MKKVYVNEKWCLGCHLCEYQCAFANSNQDNIVKALKNQLIVPRIQIEEKDNIHFAVSCRHCEEALCVQGCITGALSQEEGLITVNQDKCVGCYTCILTCPYGAIKPTNKGIIQKCELCISNKQGEPACVKGCPNQAIVFEER